MSAKTPPPLTKEQLNKEKKRTMDNIERIETMTAEEIVSFKCQIGMSRARDQVKDFLYRACNLKLAQIDNRKKLMAVNGDLDDFN